MAKIRIVNTMFYGFNGMYEYEREQGQKFYFDVELVTKNDDYAATDDTKGYVDPATVYAIVKDTVSNTRYQMLQSLGAAIGDKLLAKFENVAEVTTTIRKPSVPISGPIDYVEVEITRKAQ